MADGGEDLSESLATYEAQLSQFEAALMIDEGNEELKKLKTDLEEVITLTRELLEINEPKAEEEVSEPATPQWKPGDRCQAVRKADQQYHNATIDMIADDNVAVKFDNIGALEIVQISSLLPEATAQTIAAANAEVEAALSAVIRQSKPVEKKMSKEEHEKRKEAKKLKLEKKRKRMKEFEEAREAGKAKWQNFYKKGSSKGKHKIKGINKKSIFASDKDGVGKIGIGTCGTSGKTMTQFASATDYMYKK